MARAPGRGRPGRGAPAAPARSPRSLRWARQRRRGRLGVEALGPGAVGLGSWGSARVRPRAAQGLGALAPARANERRGPSLGVVCGGRGGPGARALEVPPPPPPGLGGGGGGRARSFLGGGIAFSSQTASLTEGPGLSRRGRRRRSRPGSVGGSAARRPRRLIHRGQPGAAAPAPGRLEGAAGVGGLVGKERGFSARGELRPPRGGSARRAGGTGGALT